MRCLDFFGLATWTNGESPRSGSTHAAGSIQSEGRRSLLENEPARNAWSGYAGQAGYHFLIAGWKVMAFLCVGVIQVITIGFGKEDLQGLYSRSKSYLDWVWWLAPLVHSSVLHWLGNVVAACLSLRLSQDSLNDDDCCGSRRGALDIGR